MISLSVYKVLHVVGAFLLMAAVAGVALHAANGGERRDNRLRGLVAGVHGAALLVMLVAGFGMLARLGLMGMPWPGWVWAKLVVWVFFAIAIALPYRLRGAAMALWILFPLLGGAAAWLAIYKPF